jgi:uncharacterized protein
MLDTLTFDSGKKGPVFLVLGSVHGDEKCGTHAIGRAVMELRSGIFSLKSGKLVTVPICNPGAYRLNQRYVDANLNRVIKKHADPQAYEHKIANELTDIIASADVVLDLHSYTSGVRPFLFIEYDQPEEKAFAAALNIPYWVTGWSALYEGQKDLWQGDTISYTFGAGKMGVLVECGQHDDPAAATVGYNCIRNALAYLGMAEPAGEAEKIAPQVTKMTSMLVKQKEGRMLKHWQHLDPVAKGTPIVQYDDGDIYAAPADGVLVMPVPKSRIGEEWVYFGVAV